MLVGFVYNIAWLLLAQVQPPGAEPAESAGGGRGGGLFEGLGFFLPAMMIVMVLYFLLMLRPQQKGQAKATEFLANLKKNDRVVTAGGILGTIVNIRPDGEYVTLRVDESTNTRLQILRQSIIRVVKDDESKKQDE